MFVFLSIFPRLDYRFLLNVHVCKNICFSTKKPLTNVGFTGILVDVVEVIHSQQQNNKLKSLLTDSLRHDIIYKLSQTNNTL